MTQTCLQVPGKWSADIEDNCKHFRHATLAQGHFVRPYWIQECHLPCKFSPQNKELKASVQKITWSAKVCSGTIRIWGKQKCGSLAFRDLLTDLRFNFPRDFPQNVHSDTSDSGQFFEDLNPRSWRCWTYSATLDSEWMRKHRGTKLSRVVSSPTRDVATQAFVHSAWSRCSQASFKAPFVTDYVAARRTSQSWSVWSHSLRGTSSTWAGSFPIADISCPRLCADGGCG